MGWVVGGGCNNLVNTLGQEIKVRKPVSIVTAESSLCFMFNYSNKTGSREEDGCAVMLMTSLKIILCFPMAGIN